MHCTCAFMCMFFATGVYSRRFLTVKRDCAVLQCMLDLAPAVGACAVAAGMGGADILADIGCLEAAGSDIENFPTSCTGCLDELEQDISSGIESLSSDLASFTSGLSTGTTNISLSSVGVTGATDVVSTTSTAASSSASLDSITPASTGPSTTLIAPTQTSIMPPASSNTVPSFPQSSVPPSDTSNAALSKAIPNLILAGAFGLFISRL